MSLRSDHQSRITSHQSPFDALKLAQGRPLTSLSDIVPRPRDDAPAAGLRRKEIDLLEWPSFRFKDNAIRIEQTQFFRPESQDSIGEIQMDPQIMGIFRQYRAKAKATSRSSPGKIQ